MREQTARFLQPRPGLSFGPVPAYPRRRERCPGNPTRAPRPRSAHTWLRPGRRSALSSPAHLGSGNTTFAQLPAAGPRQVNPLAQELLEKGEGKPSSGPELSPGLLSVSSAPGPGLRRPAYPRKPFRRAGPAHPQLPWPTRGAQ